MPKFSVTLTIEVMAGEIGTAVAAVTAALTTADVGEVAHVNAHPISDVAIPAIPMGGFGPFGDAEQIKGLGKAIGTAVREMQSEMEKPPWERGADGE